MHVVPSFALEACLPLSLRQNILIHLHAHDLHSDTSHSDSSLKELYVYGSFTANKAAWTEELQRHCKEVYDDEEETMLQQEEGINKYKPEGDQRRGENR